MHGDELERAPKIFCENIKLGFTPEYFVLGLSSGAQYTIYSLTPQHVKRLSLYLAHEISEYEKKHGVITADWNPNIKSPIQKYNKPGDKS